MSNISEPQKSEPKDSRKSFVDVLKNLLQGSAESSEHALLRRLLITGVASQDRIQIGEKVINIGEAGTVNVYNTEMTIDKDRLSSLMAAVIRENNESETAGLHTGAIQKYFKALSSINRSPYRVLAGDLGKPLSHVYIPLESASLSFEGESQFSLSTILSQTKRPGRVLIQGGPGSGKSTLLSHIATNAWENPSEIGLSAQYLPMYVRLQNLAVINESNVGLRLEKALSESGDFTTTDLVFPPGYFTAWPELLNARWLLLLDGFDEINEKYRKAMHSWLQSLLEQDVDIIITTRPTVSMHDSIRNYFSNAQYVISDPLDVGREQLIKNILGTEAVGPFLQQLKSRNIYKSIRTPLMLTVAAIVYKRAGQLPDTNIELYEAFTKEFSIGEAFQRRIEEQFPIELAGANADYIIYILERLAMAMSLDADASLQSSPNGYSSLERIVAGLFAYMNNKPKEFYLVSGTAKRIIEVVGERSGIFLCSGTVCSWLHPTFREYLTARSLVKPSPGEPAIHANSDAAWMFVGRWQEDRWRQTILFLLQAWTQDPAQDVNPILQRILSEYAGADGQLYDRAVIYVATALQEGVTVNNETKSLLFTALAEIVSRNMDENYCNRLLTRRDEVYSDLAKDFIEIYAGDPIMQKAFKDLSDKLVKFAQAQKREGDLSLTVKTSVFFDLAKLGMYDELLDLASDKELDEDIRVAALHVLGDQKHFYGLPVTGETSRYSNIEAAAIGELINLLKSGRNERVVPECLKVLKSFGRLQLLEAIVRDNDYSMEYVRVHVPPALEKDQNMILMEDEQMPSAVRLAAALAVLEVAQYSSIPGDELKHCKMKIILLLEAMPDLRDEPDRDYDLYEAGGYITNGVADSLAELMKKSYDRQFLQDIVRNNKIAASVRADAVSSISDGNCLLEVMNDEHINGRYRQIAVTMLITNHFEQELSEQQQELVKQFLQKENCDNPENILMLRASTAIDINSGNRDAAVKKLDRMIGLLPEIQWAFRLRGILNREKYNNSESLNDLNKALELDQEDTIALLEKARTLFDMKKHTDALQIFNDMGFYSYLYPQYRWIHVLTLQALFKYQAAIYICDEFLEEGEDATLLAFRALSKAAINPANRLADAFADMDRALQLAPDYHFAIFERYKLHLRTGNVIAAIDDLARYMGNDQSYYPPSPPPDYWDTPSLMTMLKIKAGLLDEAMNTTEEKLARYIDPFLLFQKAFILKLTSEITFAQNVVEEGIQLELKNETFENFLEKGTRNHLSNLCLLYLLISVYGRAKQLISAMKKNREFNSHLMNYTIPYINIMCHCFPQDQGLKEVLTYAEQSLFPDPDSQLKPLVIYAPRQPRQAYPIPMYCQKKSIHGLDDEYDWANEMFLKFKQQKRPNAADHAIALIRIKDGYHSNRIYGHCNFKKEPADDANFKFAELSELLLSTNIRVLVQGYNVTYLLFTEPELLREFKAISDQQGLTTTCVALQ